MKKFIIIFFLFIPVVFSFQITEIMYSPKDGNEWIELYTEEELNFSNVLITDNYNTDEITCCGFDLGCNLFVPEDTYFLILDQDTSFRNNSIIFFCVDDNSIGNGLGNSGDKILFTSPEKKFVSTEYNVSVEKGNTLALINNTWQETNPTPGQENKILFEPDLLCTEADLEVLSLISEPVYFNTEKKLFKIQNLDYPEPNKEINISFYYNISFKNKTVYEDMKDMSFKSYTTNTNYEFPDIGTYYVCGEIKTLSVTDTNLENNKFCYAVYVIDSSKVPCNISLDLEIEKQIFEKGEKIKFDNVLSDESFPFVIEYWVEDLFEETVKSKVLTENTNKKSYTPKVDEEDKAFLIKARLFYVACNNSNKEIYSERLVVAKGSLEEETAKEKQTDIEIEKIYLTNDHANFGDIVKARIKIIKGDTTKTALSAYIKNKDKISETTNFNVYGKNQEYIFTIPIKLKDNSENRYAEGKYYLFIEGLGKTDKQKITVRKNTQQDTLMKTSQTTKEYELVYYTKNISRVLPCLSMIKITNSEETTHNYSVWSYFYSGPVSYSGDREENLNKVKVLPGETLYVPMQNQLIKETDKELKLKVKILKDDRNVPYEITKALDFVLQEKQNNKTNFDVKESMYKERQNLQGTPKNKTKINSNVIYESSSIKLKNYSIYFVVFVIFLAAFLFFKIK